MASVTPSEKSAPYSIPHALDRHQPRHDVGFRVVPGDIAHAEHQDSHERDPQGLTHAVAQRHAPREAVAEDEHRSEQEAIEDARFRRHAAELIGDREPRRAPDRDTDDEEMKVGQTSPAWSRMKAYVKAISFNAS